MKNTETKSSTQAQGGNPRKTDAEWQELDREVFSLHEKLRARTEHYISESSPLDSAPSPMLLGYLGKKAAAGLKGRRS